MFEDGDHSGWLDGNSADASILPAQTLTAASASPTLTGTGTPFVCTTLTSTVANAQTSAVILVTIYGTNGHVGPMPLNGNGGMANGQQEVWTLDIADVGTLYAMKLLVTASTQAVPTTT